LTAKIGQNFQSTHRILPCNKHTQDPDNTSALPQLLAPGLNPNPLNKSICIIAAPRPHHVQLARALRSTMPNTRLLVGKTVSSQGFENAKPDQQIQMHSRPGDTLKLQVSSMFQVISDAQLFYLLYILPVGTWSWFLATFSSIRYYKLHATSIHPSIHMNMIDLLISPKKYEHEAKS
jgi:hypothetical protein